ncbi:peptidoglycan-binding domain-containing protein [Roseovarius aestuariivivens]|uniref:peptidoglycan-binding domain-containing protein n=1 Tax=Roseovarius aestuariivivens TaxID=1888910 RepID=UPI0010809863|nr:peptidoglycan-binding domain-containing protein [Roseovarius aestuariivivens]
MRIVSFPIAATGVLLAVSGLSGCGAPLPLSTEPELVQRLDTAPPGAAPGQCWGKDISPAVVETVTEQILLQPAELRSDGTLAEPAIYKTETRQMIVKERQETWFETPCAADHTPEFNASVQRALKARGHYKGMINGQIDARTRAAIRAYQKAQGLDSGILSMAAARQLGLVAVPRDTLD